MHPLLAKVEAKYLKDTLPENMGPGDTIRVFSKVKEGNKERLQVFEGIIIAIRGEGISKMMKVRKFSYGVGVERTFPLHSPNIEKIEPVKKGKPRRAKLFYLRERVGKRALRVKEDLSSTNLNSRQKQSPKAKPANTSDQTPPPQPSQPENKQEVETKTPEKETSADK